MKRPSPRGKREAKPAAAISLIVEEPLWRQHADAVRLIRRAARLALKVDPRRGKDAHVTILLAGDDRLRALNKAFRGKNKPTNVLSFPAAAGGAYLGDIAMAYGVIAKESAVQGKAFPAHAAHLAVHGVLHLFGHDHEEPEAAALMEAEEIRLLAGLGIADPYAPRPYTGAGKAA